MMRVVFALRPYVSGLAASREFLGVVHVQATVARVVTALGYPLRCASLFTELGARRD